MPGFIAKDVSWSRVGGDLIAIVLAHIFMIYHDCARLTNRLLIGGVATRLLFRKSSSSDSCSDGRNVLLKADRTANDPAIDSSLHAATRPFAWHLRGRSSKCVYMQHGIPVRDEAIPE
jgi:hypothetical protein